MTIIPVLTASSLSIIMLRPSSGRLNSMLFQNPNILDSSAWDPWTLETFLSWARVLGTVNFIKKTKFLLVNDNDSNSSIFIRHHNFFPVITFSSANDCNFSFGFRNFILDPIAFSTTKKRFAVRPFGWYVFNWFVATDDESFRCYTCLICRSSMETFQGFVYLYIILYCEVK